MIEVNATPVYYHDCPALGSNTKVPRALVADREGNIILFYQHKCVFCSYVAGDRQYAKGVTPLPDGGYSVDMSIAERLHSEK